MMMSPKMVDYIIWTKLCGEASYQMQLPEHTCRVWWHMFFRKYLTFIVWFYHYVFHYWKQRLIPGFELTMLQCSCILTLRYLCFKLTNCHQTPVFILLQNLQLRMSSFTLTVPWQIVIYTPTETNAMLQNNCSR